jgi:hypothetical protein
MQKTAIFTGLILVTYWLTSFLNRAWYRPAPLHNCLDKQATDYEGIFG